MVKLGSLGAIFNLSKWISGNINAAEKAPPIADVSVTGLDNGFQIVKFTGLNKHLDPDMVEFNIYHSEDSNMSGINGFAGDSDVYGRIGSVIAFHDKDAICYDADFYNQHVFIISMHFW